MSIRLSVALVMFVGTLAGVLPNGVSSLANNDNKNQAQKADSAKKVPPPVDYVIPVPKISLGEIETLQDKDGTVDRIRIDVENWKGYVDGLFVKIAKPYMPGCEDAKPVQKAEPFFRLVTQLFDENNKRFDTPCSQASNSQNQFRFQFFFHLKTTALPKSAYLLLTDSKTGKQYKSNLISLPTS